MKKRPSSVKNARGKTLKNLKDDPETAANAEFLSPLSGLMTSTVGRSKTKTAGEGTFGRVNIETISGQGSFAAKYTLSDEKYSETLAELAVLKYLKGFPHVAQLITTVDQNTTGKKLPLPSLLMGYAPKALNNRTLYTSWDDLLHTVIGVLQGYNTLHSLGIIHRDTKPANMLMTAREEVWITDFGMSRYETPVIPPCQDGYTGTYWYASPEVLMKNIIKEAGRSVEYTYEGWRAHDAWAVGASLYHILVGKALFSGDGIEGVLQRICDVKGMPEEADGEAFTLTNRLLGLFNFPEDTITISRRILARTVFKPSADRSAELETVTQIIEGLLNYNPTRRLTIQGALNTLVAAKLMRADEPLESPPTLLDQYSRAYLPSAVNAEMIDILFNWMNDVCMSFRVAEKTRHVVFDRACLYTRIILDLLRDAVTRENIQAYGILSVLIAGDLFDETGRGIDLDDAREVTAKAYSISKLKEYLSTILMLPIDYLGETYYDRMMKSARTDKHRERAIMINEVCFIKGIYQKYAPVHIMEVLESMMMADTEITGITMRAAFTDAMNAKRIANNAIANEGLKRLELLHTRGGRSRRNKPSKCRSTRRVTNRRVQF